MISYFFFGTLCDMDMLELVPQRKVDRNELQNAWYPDAKLCWAPKDNLPVLVESKSSELQGYYMANASDKDAERIVFFEDVEYTPQRHTVRLQSGEKKTALIYADSSLEYDATKPWCLHDWQGVEKPLAMILAKQWMTHLGGTDLDAYEAEWQALRSQLLAAGEFSQHVA